MDSTESIPCSIDGSAFGRVGGDMAPVKVSNAATITRPHIRDRGGEWISLTDEVDPFVLRQSRVSTSSSRLTRVRYVADSLDEQWVDKVAAGGRRGNLKLPISVSLLENIFTALEIQAAQKPSITFHRIHFDASQGAILNGATPALVDQVTEYWKSKRRANGGMPLVAALATVDDARICQEDVLGDCPLPFVTREGEMYATVQVQDTPWRKRPRIDESSERLVDASRRLATALLRRENALCTHLKLTLYELATLRADAYH